MKRILIVSPLFPPEPVVSANLSYEIALKLSENFHVTVISQYPSRPNGFIFKPQENTDFPFKHIYLKTYLSHSSDVLNRFRESYSFGLKTKKFISQNSSNFDCIYMNTWPLIAQFFTVSAAKKFSIPITTHVHDLYPESLIQKLPFFNNILQKILLPIDIFILNNSAFIVTISESMKNILIETRRLPENKVSVVYNWQNESKFIVSDSTKSESDKKFKFMYLGSINRLANIDSLLTAFNQAKLNNSEFIVAGEGSEKENLINFVNKSKLKNIKFLSFDPKNIGEIQSSSDVLVLSLKKGASSYAFPSKIPAYMFSAKPILAFIDIPSEIFNTIKTSNCGWCIDVSDITSLALKMEYISNKPKEKLRKLGHNGRVFALNNLSSKVNLKKITSIIELSMI